MSSASTAIRAAEVVGLSRPARADERGTVAALVAHRRDLIDPLTSRNRVRLANTTGDSLLVDFPGAVETVRFAVAMQAGLAERSGALTADGRRPAIGPLKDALALDPDLLEAHCELCGRDLGPWRFGSAADPEETPRLARHHAARNLEIDQSDDRGSTGSPCCIFSQTGTTISPTLR